jgi:hypothetical protein
MKKENTSSTTDRDNSKDTGMALALLCVLLGYYGHHPRLMPLAVFILVIDMVWPNVFYYPAKAWFGFAHLMGTISSKVVLTLLFYGVVTPIGVLRRAAGADPMQRKHWKKGTGSVFKTREHTYATGDIERPY